MSRSEKHELAIAAAGNSLRSSLTRFAQLPLVRCLIIMILGAAVHFPALKGKLIWDDLELVGNNPLIKSPVFILEAFRHHLFPGEYAGHYRPLQTVSYIFDYLFWNTHTFGYHLTNVLWHVLSGVLLFLLLGKLLAPLAIRQTGDRGRDGARLPGPNVAWLLALLWVVHPVHSAAVDYISGRADSLAFCFACSAWLLYLQARATSRSVSWRVTLYVVAAACALSALCSRETGGLWMVIFLVHLFAFDGDLRSGSKLSVLVVCLAVAVLYAGLRMLPETRSTPAVSNGWTLPMRGVLMLRALGDYGGLMVFPSKLHVERTVLNRDGAAHGDHWKELLGSDHVAIGGVALLIALVGGALGKGAGRSARIFGAVWFVITYLPTSNLFDLNATVAEHWLYLPSVGLLIFVAGSVVELPGRWSRCVAFVGCTAVLLLSVRSAMRSSDWVDPETFFLRTFAAGGSSSRIGVNLAVIYARHGENAKAEDVLRKVLEVSPDYPLARSNLALALAQQGKKTEAAAILEGARAFPTPQPSGYRRTCDAALSLARLRRSENDTVTALAIVNETLHDYPRTWDLISLKSQLIGEREGITAAIPVVQAYVDKSWWNLSAVMTLAKLRLQTGDVASAAAGFRNASRLDIYGVESLNAAALLEVAQNQIAAACETQRRAIARQPDQPRQYLLLAELLQKNGRPAEAERALAVVAHLQATADPHVAAE